MGRSDNGVSDKTQFTSQYNNQCQSKAFVPNQAANKYQSFQSGVLNNTNGKLNKSSLLEINASLEKLEDKKKTDISGQNALLSLLSQDDFAKLNKEIHNRFDI